MYPIPANATRIRYLESTGTQYVDTGFVPESSTSFEVQYIQTSSPYVFAPIAYSGVTYNSADTFGTAINNAVGTNSYYGTTYNVHTGDNKIYVGATVTVQFRRGNANVIVTNNTTGNTSTTSLGSATFARGSRTLYLFNGNTTLADLKHPACLKLFSFKLYNGATIVRDYIPVRVGSVGYLYDRVSGQLFGNAGTGAFVLGPDTFQQGVVPTRMMVGGVRKKPYDAEVEYLYNNPTGGGSNTSHKNGAAIDTGVIPSDDLKVRIGVMFLQYNAYGAILGVETGDWSSDGYRLRREGTNVSKLSFYIGNQTTKVENNGYSQNNILNIECGNKFITINGSTTTGTQSSGSEQSQTLVVCCVRRNGNLVDYSNMRLYSLKLIRGTTVLRDFIPVRKGTTGYLYDKVSKQLFGNIGTRDFTLGPDK